LIRPAFAPPPAAPADADTLDVASRRLLGALQYVATHPFLRYCRIAVLTQGVGASAALAAMATRPELVRHRLHALSVCQPAALSPAGDVAAFAAQAARIVGTRTPLLVCDTQDSGETGGVGYAVHDAWRSAGGRATLVHVRGYPVYGRARRFDGSRYFGEVPSALLELLRTLRTPLTQRQRPLGHGVSRSASSPMLTGAS